LGLNYAINYEKVTKTTKGKCLSNTYKQESYLWSGRGDVFSENVDSAINICLENNENLLANIIRSYKVRFFIQNNNFEDAYDYYLSYKDEVISTQYPLLIAEFQALASQIYLYKKDYDTARTLSLEAIQLVNVNDSNLPLITAYESLYLIAKSQENYQEALSFYEKFSSAKIAYHDIKTQQQLAYYLARGEIEVKNQRIELLDKDNELLYLQQNIYRNEAKNGRIIMGLFSVLLIVLAIFSYRGLIGRKRFKIMAEFDLLTGISNRYHFNNQAKVALEFCENNSKPVALILFDLDNFKAINDEFGHATGDWALQQIVNICKNFMRNNDVFGRIGGEEFAVLLPSCQADKAVLLAEICHDAITGIDTVSSGHIFTLKASFGVSSSDISGYLLKQLLADADAAMYKAKQSVQDKVVAFN
ncbi:GGDEF domain-containing protein, partial [Chromatiaceae bacterium AAb-1]|nr:GGDEF domain-containing protein [Chromatiaceae bacterium AAb-1]